MTRSACLIFNPVAEQGNSEQDLATIKSILDSEFDLDIQFTTNLPQKVVLDKDRFLTKGSL